MLLQAKLQLEQGDIAGSGAVDMMSDDSKVIYDKNGYSKNDSEYYPF